MKCLVFMCLLIGFIVKIVVKLLELFKLVIYLFLTVSLLIQSILMLYNCYVKIAQLIVPN